MRKVQLVYNEIIDAVARQCPTAKVKGVSVQKMARPGIEVILGINKDTKSGPVLMFGLGGVHFRLQGWSYRRRRQDQAG